jgi:hypothetical protein
MSMASAKNGTTGVRAFTATAQAMKAPVLAAPLKMSQASLRLKPAMFRPAPLPKPQLMRAAQTKL